MKVSEVMSVPVVVTQGNKSVKHVRELISRKDINAIPILSMEGEIEGILSATDLASEVNEELQISKLMSSHPYVVSIDSGVKDAARMMDKHQVHHLIAMENGEVRGILSSMDIVSLFANQ